MVRFVLGEIICRADQHFLLAIPVQIGAQNPCDSHLGMVDPSAFQKIADCVRVKRASGISD